MVSVLSEFAPAKINLHLHVVGRRDDGYHMLDSLVVFAGVGDRLGAAASDALSLSVTGPFATALDADADNLVLRAARALAARAGCPALARLVLEKNLPVASGIGGGSADAAAALRLLCRLWRIEPSVEDLAQLACDLGADVKVCLVARPALMSGVGEVLVPAPSLPVAGLVLVNPGVAVSTPSVFRARSGEFSGRARFPAHGWRDVRALVADLAATRNDLERPARMLAPAIGTALDALAATPDCRLARMSGSGATCFGLFDTPEAARRATGGIVRDGGWVWGGGMNDR
jgi:4-diphosphocytidyl-2-C-methyl-D-erythritol kinase